MSKTKTKKTRKKMVQKRTERVEMIKHGKVSCLPISAKLMKTLGIKNNTKLFWTAVDGVLQLSTNAPVCVIPVLDRPEERFMVSNG